MQTYLFNDSWFFTDSDDLRARFHNECAPLMEVTLPHDAMIGKKRSPNLRRGNLAGYYPGGTYVYTKTYFFPPETAQSHCVLEFGGVYANAMFFVNDCFAGKCPYGYSRFFLDLDKFLRHGENNVIKVVSRSGADTRCYSGGGHLSGCTAPCQRAAVYRAGWPAGGYLLTGTGPGGDRDPHHPDQ